MNADRELLELAAKAAGVGPLDFDYAEHEGHDFYVGPRLPMPQGVLMAAMWTYWAPLDDDGDALRLAVNLGLEIHQYVSNKEVGVTIYETEKEITEFHNGDACAATRRAIVRAAAELGKALP